MTSALNDTRPAPNGLRHDIQALRALAVMAVVLYHLWPQEITGGYVGVDIFFVISGFLITGQLLRESRTSGSIRLGNFWARRARRLLPASLIVIVSSLLATVLFVPQYFWKQFFSEFIASALYFQNWRLSWDAVDYLARDNIASPVEHFWSLSVEEQFYFVWPLLILAGWRLMRGRHLRQKQALTTVIIGLVTVSSLVFCIVETQLDLSNAYFATTTRAWEFGAGSLLACLPVRDTESSTKVKSVVVWIGLGLIAVSVFAFTDGLQFPGYLATLPVAGTVAVIWAGVGRENSLAAKLMRAEPLQFLGRNSYSAYLWHWPLIVILPFVVGGSLSWQWRIVILVVSFALAVITRVLVEDPIRNSSRLHQGRPARTYIWSVAALAVVVGATGTVAAIAFPGDSGQPDEVSRALSGGCLGAGPAHSLGKQCNDPAIDNLLLPDSAQLIDDNGIAFDCWSDKNQPLQSCGFGPATGNPLRVALVGDSHAAMLLPGLVPELDRANWRLDSYVGWGCQWTDSFENQCEGARADIRDHLISGSYDLIVTTASRHTYAGQPYEQAVQDYITAWKPVVATGTKVIVIADNPMPSPEARHCLLESGDDHARAAACTTARSTAYVLRDHLIDAAAATGVPLVSLDEAYCTETDCPMVSNHVVVYRDNSHITATFSRTLGPVLMKELQAVVSRG